MKFKKFAFPYIIWILIFTIIPLAMIMVYAFTTGSFGKIDGIPTLENFRMFFSKNYMPVFFSSISIAIESTIICLLIGYPFAFIVSRLSVKTKNMMLLLIVLPMWMNFLLRTYSWMTILSRNGLLNQILMFFGREPLNLSFSRSIVLLGMVYNFLPFMILPIYSILSKLDTEYLEAAEDLGATKFQSFLKITLPMSMPGVVTGIIMVFIPAISTFEISALLGGNKYNLIGNVIQTQFMTTGNWNLGSAMNIVLMIFIIISILIGVKSDKNEFEERGTLW